MKKNIISALTFVFLFFFFLPSISGNSAENPVYIISISGSINPGSADYIKKGIERASEDNAVCLIIELNTPGGLVESMREIVMDMLASRVPVVVYVAPGGARAASAGVIITVAADIAVMAPGTHIGAAHPVGIGGKEISKTMSEKVVNDMAAYARTIARKRGKNVDWVERAVRESVSITEKEALRENVIDLIAPNLDELISRIHGLQISGKGALEVKSAPRIRLEEDLRTRILRTISDPNIAYILMMIGIAGLYFELAHPGAVFPGVVGGICIVLAFFAFHTLPVNYAGFLLIALAIIFFILEMKIVSYGMLSIAGIVSMLLGSLMLFEGEGTYVQLSLKVLLPTVVFVSGFFVAVSALVFKSQMSKTRTGAEGLIGNVGVVRSALEPEGKVFIHGELWQAVSDQPVPEGTQVRVVNVVNLKLVVERVSESRGLS